MLLPLLIALAVAAPRIAVIDSGIAPIPPLTPTLTQGIDLTGSGTTSDRYGHGTQIASIIHRECPRCILTPVKAIGDSGHGSADQAAQGIAWAVRHGANLINLSLTLQADAPILDQAITDACAAGVTVVVAAGNDGTDVGYPGETAPCAVTVGSRDHGNIDTWSDRGAWVDLWAPGYQPALTPSGAATMAVGTSGSAAYVTGLYGQLACEQDPTATVDAASWLARLTG